ncbi:MAG: hypothetical protein Q8K67_11320 [Geothrix sp.]|nr:hypothetical protein [Geothrix sp.]
MTLRAWGLALLAAMACGFIAGRWSVPPAKPLTIGAKQALPERDLSPKGEVRTVIVTRIVPGTPEAPPAHPEGIGQHLSTTATALPALAGPGTFHSAIFGQVEGPRLTLRTLQWLDTPAGRVSLGDASTRETVTSFPMPRARPEPRWTVAALPAVQDGRLIVGAMVEHTRGPLVIGVGYLDNRAFGIVGARW